MNTKQSLKNRNVSLKTVAVTAVLVGLLVFGTTYYVLSPATINVYLDDLPTNAYYTVKTDATNIWVIRFDGYKAHESTSAATEIQWAINNLPAGRTSKYTVQIMAGNYTLTASTAPQIAVPAYTRLVGHGAILKLGAVADAYTRILQTNGDYVDLVGLTLDGVWQSFWPTGNGTNQGVNYQFRSSHVLVDNCVSMRARVNGFEAWGYEGDVSGLPLHDIWYRNCKSIDDGFNSFNFGHSVVQSGAIQCFSHGIGDIAFAASGTIHGTPAEITYVDCVGEAFDGTHGSSNGHFGFKFEGSWNCSVIGGAVYGVATGVFDDADAHGGNTAQNVYIYANQTSAWDCGGVHWNTGNSHISGCHIVIKSSLSNVCGIRNDGNGTMVMGNYVEAEGTGIGIFEASTSYYCSYIGNNLLNCGTNATLSGSDHVWLGNVP